MSRLFEMLLGNDHRCGAHAVPREHCSRGGGTFADQKGEIEAGFFQAAGSGRERKATRQMAFKRRRGCPNCVFHATEIGSPSAMIVRVTRSGITVATTATKRQVRRFAQCRQSRSIFSVSDWRAVAENPRRRKNSGACV